MREYDPKEIEPKWQAEWEKGGINNAKEKGKKYYSLIEFPYPSGEGLHVGHPRPYIGMDVVSRKRRMQGYDVLYPIGWDAFGLPTENYALKTGKDPRQVTKENTDTFRRQIKSLGISFDWSREINTTDPKYYKWTQWIFLQFLKHGLAYKAKTLVNWCPKDRIVLANEEVVDGHCERCGTLVEKKEKEQWLLAITKYAQRLYDDLENVDYPERVKAQQRNWIGPSEGALIKFDDLEVFTTRPDTIFGATFVVKAGKEDKFTGEYVTNPATKEKIPVWEAEYVYSDYGTGAIMAVPAHDERDFDFAKKHNLPIKEVIIPRVIDVNDPPRKGVKTVERTAIQAIVIHPKTQKILALKWKKLPWTTFITGGVEEGEDIVEGAKREILEETGFGNVKYIRTLGGPVESHFFANHKDENRKALFHALVFELENEDRREVAEEEKQIHETAWMTWKEMEKDKNTKCAEYDIWKDRYFNETHAWSEAGVLVNSGKFDGQDSESAKKEITKFVRGKWITKYKLRDWIFSRQRYWGEPIPVVFCEKCGTVPVPDKDLPVELPHIEKYQPGADGESPLANIPEWVNTVCPKCGGNAKRETDVMPNWAGSSWYFLRYTDPFNDEEFASKKALKHWMGVDWYNGGMEHTTLHLLYSRFWNKFLFDIGLVPTAEPYLKRTSHGIILAESGEKMSKSKGNVVNPDTIVDQFGADTLRVYEMFMGPFEQAIAWSEKSLVGPRRFLERVWRLKDRIDEADAEEFLLHSTMKKVTIDIENLGFNTAISSLMIWTNELEKREKISRNEYESLLLLLAPFAPHICEELWHELGHPNSIHGVKWPEYDEKKLKKDEVTYAVQVDGKVRGTITVSALIAKADLENLAKSKPEIGRWLDGKTIQRVIIVPNKVINIVIAQ